MLTLNGVNIKQLILYAGDIKLFTLDKLSIKQLTYDRDIKIRILDVEVSKI